MTQPGHATPRRNAHPQPGQRTEKILMPNRAWLRDMRGGWVFYTGAAPPEEETNIELFARGDHPQRWGAPEWVVYLRTERGGSPILRNPVVFEGPDYVKYEFWPDCFEDLQALLQQVGRYGYAQPALGGWKVTVAVTAAAARSAVADGSYRHAVNRKVDDTEWMFTATGTPVSLVREPALSQAAPDHRASGICLESDNTEAEATHDSSANTRAAMNARSNRPGAPGVRHSATNPPQQGRAR